MSDDLQREIGRMQAQLETLRAQVKQLQGAAITAGAGSIGVVIAMVLRNAGLL